MFEPKLKSYGLDSHESLVKVQDNGLLVQNTDGGCSINLEEGMKIGVLKGIIGQIISVECDCGMSSKNGTVVESAKKDSSMTGEKVMGDSVCASVNGERYSSMESSIEQPRELNEGLVESLALPQEKFSDTQFSQLKERTGRPFRLPLTPIHVGGLFHRLGVDLLQLPLTTKGNRYVVCFMDYPTKWVEAFAISDQRAEIVCRACSLQTWCT